MEMDSDLLFFSSKPPVPDYRFKNYLSVYSIPLEGHLLPPGEAIYSEKASIVLSPAELQSWFYSCCFKGKYKLDSWQHFKHFHFILDSLKINQPAICSLLPSGLWFRSVNL